MTTFKIIGKTKELFISETIRKILGLIVILITAQYGVMVMVYGLLAYSIMDVVISAFFLNHSLPIGVLNQIRESITPVLYSIIAGLLCYLIADVVHDIYLRFVICIIAFAGIYLGLSVLFKERGVSFLKNYFK